MPSRVPVWPALLPGWDLGNQNPAKSFAFDKAHDIKYQISYRRNLICNWIPNGIMRLIKRLQVALVVLPGVVSDPDIL